MQVAADVMDVKDAFTDAEFLDSLSLIQNNYNLTNVQKAEPLFWHFDYMICYMFLLLLARVPFPFCFIVAVLLLLLLHGCPCYL